MKKTLQIALILLIFSSCSTVKQGWKDFTAYYNTFYNTKQFYNAGLKSNIRQAPALNPMVPIRIHQPPTNAGLDDFQHAIERGSFILRNHEESKYVLPALSIIGKSFYYRSEYFSALEKFQELAALGTGTYQQEAILWQGLTYLEMENYAEGIRFIDIGSELIEDWDPQILAEVHAVQAQLYTASGNWESAIEYLQQSISALEDREKKARAYFLLGQIYERTGSDNQALFAYSQIGEIRTSFEMEYHATRKEAEVSRRIDSFNRAEYLYRKMLRDDKFFDYRNELQYEIARTLQMKGDTDEAITTYNEVLKDRTQTPSNLTRAKTYFGLAEIYRDQLADFSLAAAYFDSASAQRVDSALLPDGFNARELADSFGQYATIKQQISEKDSLLHLATLSPEELDEFVAEQQAINMAQLEEEMSRMQDERSRLLVTEEPDSVIDAGESTEFGFLNIRSQATLADASLQFQAIWGDRPLADNWRRRADVSGSRFDQMVIINEREETIELQAEAAETGILPTIDLSAIPFTEDEQMSMKSEIAELHYRLANVFFLELNMPDSAKTYYQKVIDNSEDWNLITMSLYSLTEIEILNNNMNEAVNWFNRLQEISPNSVYARRLAERLNIELIENESKIETPIQQQYLNLVSVADTTETTHRADELIRLAGNGINDSQRSLLLFEAAREYIAIAKKESNNHDTMVQNWFQKQQEFNDLQTEFIQLKDSSKVMLADTTLSDSELNYWQQIADSTLTTPDFTELFPFEGAYWDSTRSILSKIETQYASSTIMPDVRVLQETLKKPEEPEQEELAAVDPDTESALPEDEAAAELQSCEDVGLMIDYEGGLNAFMSAITFPSWTENISMRGEVVYLFDVQPDGSIENYEQMSRMDRSGIPQSVENAIERLFKFHPTRSEEIIQCSMIFPIDL